MPACISSFVTYTTMCMLGFGGCFIMWQGAKLKCKKKKKKNLINTVLVFKRLNIVIDSTTYPCIFLLFFSFSFLQFNDSSLTNPQMWTLRTMVLTTAVLCIKHMTHTQTTSPLEKEKWRQDLPQSIKYSVYLLPATELWSYLPQSVEFNPFFLFFFFPFPEVKRQVLFLAYACSDQYFRPWNLYK